MKLIEEEDTSIKNEWNFVSSNIPLGMFFFIRYFVIITNVKDYDIYGYYLHSRRWII